MGSGSRILNFYLLRFHTSLVSTEIDPKERNFQSYLQKEDQQLILGIGEEEARSNHLNLQQRLFRQALKKNFQNVKTRTTTEGLNVHCEEYLTQQAFSSGWFRCAWSHLSVRTQTSPLWSFPGLL